MAPDPSLHLGPPIRSRNFNPGGVRNTKNHERSLGRHNPSSPKSGTDFSDKLNRHFGPAVRRLEGIFGLLVSALNLLIHEYPPL